MQTYTIDVFSRTTGERWDVNCVFDEFADMADAVKSTPFAGDATVKVALALVPPRKRFFNDAPETVAFRRHNMTAFLHAAVRNPKVRREGGWEMRPYGVASREWAGEVLVETHSSVTT